MEEFEYNLVVLIFDPDNRVALRTEATLSWNYGVAPAGANIENVVKNVVRMWSLRHGHI